MTTDERQISAADRFAVAWLADAVERQQSANERADAYAAECAQWLELSGWSFGACPAVYAEQGGAIGAPQSPEPAEPRSGLPGPVPAAPRRFVSGSRRDYARQSGDPGAKTGYEPDWAEPLAPGERRR